MNKTKKLNQYQLDYKDNETGEYETHQFEAKNDAEARLYAEDFCNQGWHKLYGVLRLSKGGSNE